jgi:antitoxin (DNA-binding transcriptional repressor) of toxin-antitoxin stability system
MRTVNIGVLKNQLSAYLQIVRKGEEVIVRDRNEAEVAYLIATGQAKAPKEKMDWEAFWALPRPTVSDEAVKEALDWARGD